MISNDSRACFKARLLRPALPKGAASWAFLILPKDASAKLPRRGRTSVKGTLNEHHFQATLEPDGQLSHWLQVSNELREAAGAEVGDIVSLELVPVDSEPEPQLPPDLQKALAAATEARGVWDQTTTLARLDWIHWVESAKQAKTRAKRISDTCEMLAAGKKRVCCFDQSGYYSKALRAPKEAGVTDEATGAA